MENSALTPWRAVPGEIPQGVHGFSVQRHDNHGNIQVLAIEKLLDEETAIHVADLLNNGTPVSLLVALPDGSFVRGDTVTAIDPHASFVSPANDKRYPAKVVIMAQEYHEVKCRSYADALKLAEDVREQVENSVRRNRLVECRTPYGDGRRPSGGPEL